MALIGKPITTPSWGCANSLTTKPPFIDKISLVVLLDPRSQGRSAGIFI